MVVWAGVLGLGTLLLFTAFASTWLVAPPEVTIPPHPSIAPAGSP